MAMQGLAQLLLPTPPFQKASAHRFSPYSGLSSYMPLLMVPLLPLTIPPPEPSSYLSPFRAKNRS